LKSIVSWTLILSGLIVLADKGYHGAATTLTASNHPGRRPR
jgi:hypothetical protein